LKVAEDQEKKQVEEDCLASEDYYQLLECAKYYLNNYAQNPPHGSPGHRCDIPVGAFKLDAVDVQNLQLAVEYARKAVSLSPGGEAEVVLEDVLRYLKMAEDQEENENNNEDDDDDEGNR
jgi:hypothetical protein